MKVLRILMITTTYFGFNGITSVVMNYYRNIDRSKIQFDFAIGNGIHESVKNEVKELGGKIYELPSRKKNTFSYFKSLKNLIKENKYTIVHAHGNSGTLYFDIHVAKSAGVPVRIAHSHNSTCTYKLIHYLLKRPLNRDLTDALACSKLAGDWLYDRSYTVMNNGIYIDKFIFNNKIREEYRQKFNLKDKFVIGHIGHFSYQKNHEFLLDIFNEVHKLDSRAVLMLIGDGKLRTKIENKILELGLKDCVLYLGKRKDTPELIQAMDIFVFPSRFEGLPVVLIETQVSGLRCIVSDVITAECKMSEKVEYLSLDKSAKYWAKQIVKYNTNYIRDDMLDILIQSNYNIKNETKKLQEFYLSKI